MWLASGLEKLMDARIGRGLKTHDRVAKSIALEWIQLEKVKLRSVTLLFFSDVSAESIRFSRPGSGKADNGDTRANQTNSQFSIRWATDL